MAIREISANSDVTQATEFTISGLTPVSGRTSAVLIAGEGLDSNGVSLSSVTGTNGWNASWTVKSTEAYAANHVHAHIAWCIPSSSVAGNIVVTFSAAAERIVWFVIDWDDADTTTPFPSTAVTAEGESTSSAVTHGTMADSTNNILVAFGAYKLNVAANGFAHDGNYTGFTSSALDASNDLMSGSAQYIVGGADLTCNSTWTNSQDYITTIVEFAKAAGGVATKASSIQRQMGHK